MRTNKELIEIAKNYMMEIIKGKNSDDVLLEISEQYSKEESKNIYLLMKYIIARNHKELGISNTPDCRKCKHMISLPMTHHIACNSNCAVALGKEHGIKNGWFCYPFNFDPIWLDYCDNFESRDDSEE